jgi:hypothetical protein
MKKEFVICFALLLLPFGLTAQQIVQLPNPGSTSVMGGEYNVANNVWGTGAGVGNQTLSVDLNSTYWKVILSTHNSASVASYPFIWKGSHWGNATTKNNPMPKMLKQIGTAPFSWSIDTTGVTGTWDAAFECWIDDVPASTNYDGELMIWINYGGGAGPAGGVVATVNIGGYTWDVYFYLMSSWNYIAYKIKTPVTSVSLDLTDFLRDALTRGYLKTSWYLANMEAGFEIWRNGQGLTTKSYSANVTTGSSLNQNYPPAPFALVYPPNNKYISSPVSLVIPFSWNASNDPNGDELIYIFHLYGPNVDTTIADLDTTSLVFDGSRCLQYFTQYNWEVKATDGFDTVTSTTNAFKTPRSTGVNDIDPLPHQFSLEQNFPNPFNPATIIRVQTQVSGLVILKVYDVLGREVATLLNEQKPPGIYSVQWNANSCDAGVYFSRLSVYPASQQGINSSTGKGEQTNTFFETEKMLLIK